MRGRLLRCLLFASVCGIAGCTPSQQQTVQRRTDDALLVAQVRARIAAVDATTISLVHVRAARAVVTLTGQVHSQAQRAAVESAAKSVGGVHQVVDRLTVNPNAPTQKELADDLALAARVKTALIGQIGVNSLRVSVTAHAGVITLSGRLPSDALRTAARDSAAAVPGVRKVVTAIAVGP